MAGIIFINYRRDDVPGDARGIRAALVSEFGKSSVFMDVDNLLAGQRFDKELEKALAQCDVLIVVMGPRWMELLAQRAASGERDYVREEIAAALKRNITVIPVRVGREGTMAPLPRADQLPEDIRELVMHQKQDVAHERFGRDMVELTSAIRAVRQSDKPPVSLPKIAAGGTTAIAAALAALWFSGGIPHGTPAQPPAAATAGAGTVTPATPQSPAATTTADAQRAADEAMRETSPAPKPGDTFRDCPDVCPEMVAVPAGKFTMGSPESEKGHIQTESPQHEVVIRRPFAVGKLETAVREYEAFVSETGGVSDGGGCSVWSAYGHHFDAERTFRTPSFSQAKDNPVVCVSWQAAISYTNWLTTKTGKSYRLLSESEWEYVARANSPMRFSFGEQESELCQYANGADRTSAFLWGNHACTDGAGVQTASGGSYKPNNFGLYDTLGNAAEWVQDCVRSNYEGAPEDGSARMDGQCEGRIIRGGAWDNDVNGLRVAARGTASLKAKDTIGFRVARDLD